jgi:hypothetical protein
MKRFLRKVGLLTVAMTMMSSGVAYGDDANPLNKWTFDFTTTNLGDAARYTGTTDVPTRGGIQKVNKNQRVYWALDKSPDGTGLVYGVGQSGTRATCTAQAAATGHETSGCVSAPLKIASPNGATICMLADINAASGTGTTDSLRIQLNICADDTCTEKLSTQLGSPLQQLGDTTGAATTSACGVNIESYDSPISPDLAGQTIYFAITNSGGATADGSPLVWVVGR